MPLGPDSVMTFGKYKGLPVSQLPAHYINWALYMVKDPTGPLLELKEYLLGRTAPAPSTPPATSKRRGEWEWLIVRKLEPQALGLCLTAMCSVLGFL